MKNTPSPPQLSDREERLITRNQRLIFRAPIPSFKTDSSSASSSRASSCASSLSYLDRLARSLWHWFEMSGPVRVKPATGSEASAENTSTCNYIEFNGAWMRNPIHNGLVTDPDPGRFPHADRNAQSSPESGAVTHLSYHFFFFFFFFFFLFFIFLNNGGTLISKSTSTRHHNGNKFDGTRMNNG